MAVIKSGASTDQLTVDVTSKAARETPYDSRGNNRGLKATYRAATANAVVAAAGTGLFFLIEGSSTKTIRLQRLGVSGETLTAVAYANIQLQKYSTAASGGTATTLTQVPVDSGSAAGTAGSCKVYTAAPTAGSLVGPLGEKRLLMQSTTAAAAGIPNLVEWDFRNGGESEGPVLRGTTQGIALNFGGAPASAVTLSVEVEWTEE